MDLRQASGIHWPIVSLAGVAGGGDTGEGENAGRTCLLCAEACG